MRPPTPRALNDMIAPFGVKQGEGGVEQGLHSIS